MTQRASRPAPQRIRAEEAAAMLGVSRRGVQALAARGDLPGAAKIGTLWTFDPAKVARFAANFDPKKLKADENATRLDLVKSKFKHNHFIYVVGYGPYVKIGFTSVKGMGRIKALQTGAPEKLNEYARFQGSLHLEAFLHHKFRAYRINGEWFRKRGTLARWLAADCPFPEKYDPSKKVAGSRGHAR